jgi:8-oxo-dGTP pyrophosphatase MutT (NUDIX family)
MARRFARLRPGAPPFAPGFFGVPSDGMCLNVFLVVQPPDDPSRVLVGRPAPNPRWEEVGALDPSRLERLGDRWMLPSSQLVLLEAPDEAARRLANEQLGLDPGPLPPPRVFSDTYPRRGPPDADPHWDLHLLYLLRGPTAPPRTPLWKTLEYVAVATIPRVAFGRDHGDILDLIGLHPAG